MRCNHGIGLLLRKKKLHALHHCISWACYSVANHPWMGKYLKVVAARESFITKEMNFIIFAFRDVVKAIRFIPSLRENVKRNLAPNRVGQVQIDELIFQDIDHCLPNFVNLRVKILF